MTKIIPNESKRYKSPVEMMMNSDDPDIRKVGLKMKEDWDKRKKCIFYLNDDEIRELESHGFYPIYT